MKLNGLHYSSLLTLLCGIALYGCPILGGGDTLRVERLVPETIVFTGFTVSTSVCGMCNGVASVLGCTLSFAGQQSLGVLAVLAIERHEMSFSLYAAVWGIYVVSTVLASALSVARFVQLRSTTPPTQPPVGVAVTITQEQV